MMRILTRMVFPIENFLIFKKVTIKQKRSLLQVSETSK